MWKEGYANEGLRNRVTLDGTGRKGEEKNEETKDNQRREDEIVYRDRKREKYTAASSQSLTVFQKSSLPLSCSL